MYTEKVVAPMRAELVDNGFEELKTPEAVTSVLNDEKGVTLLVINSVCGCAAGGARPAVLKSLQHTKKPDKCVTVFAGVDMEATQKAREYMLPYPPSSPAIALFKDGKLVHIIERHSIDGNSPASIIQNLVTAYDQFCN